MQEATITAYINTQLKATQFTAARFQKGRFNGIAELLEINEEGETMPCVVDNDGDTTKLGIDDTYPFEVYHRVIGATFEDIAADFGDGSKRRQTTSMKMVVMGNRGALNMTKENIISGVSLGMPLFYPKSSLAAIQLHSCTIQPGAFNTDQAAVYAEEFNIAELLIKPNSLIFALDYTITTEAFIDCYSICS